MFGLGAGEVFFIIIIALAVFGPENIPEIAKWLGKTSGELRRMSDAVRREFYNGLYVPPPEVSPQEGRKTLLVVSAETASGAAVKGGGSPTGTGGGTTEEVGKETTVQASVTGPYPIKATLEVEARIVLQVPPEEDQAS